MAVQDTGLFIYEPTSSLSKEIIFNGCKNTFKLLQSINGNYFSWESIVKAGKDLKGESFKVWIYLCDCFTSKEHFAEFGYSICKNWGIKRDTFYKSREKLILMHYLVPIKDLDGAYYFFAEKEWGEKYYNECCS